MYRIVEKHDLNPSICMMDLEEPDIARKAKAGQFVVLRIDDTGERIPITIFQADPAGKTVKIIFQKVGKTTYRLATLKAGDELKDLIGPLGNPTHIERFGKVICIGGGVGTAEIYPTAKALKEAGNELAVIVGARTRELLILEEELKMITNRVFVTTDDGSYARKGFVTDALKELLEKERFDRAFAVGPIPMMKAVCEATRPYELTTIVSLGSNMIDATGMCGTCRVTVKGEMKFTCVNGPEFDGHQVDFDELAARDKRFAKQEKESLEIFRQKCHLEHREQSTENREDKHV